VVFGYYVNWDRASIVSLRLNLQHLTHLVPEWLVLANGKGDLSDESDPTVIQIAADAKLPILAMVTNYREGWRAGWLHEALSRPEGRANIIDNIASNLAEHKFAGVNIDFEELGVRDREAMVVFMRDLAQRLKPSGYLVTQSVPGDDPAYDLTRLAGICDYIVPMVYDEHYQSSAPGPVASQEWFDRQMERLRGRLPLEKTVIGLGTYGYDWVIGATGSAEVSFGDVISAARANKAPVSWDPDTQNPVLRYEAKGRRHEVWFLDAVTGSTRSTRFATPGSGAAPCGDWARRTRDFGTSPGRKPGRRSPSTRRCCGRSPRSAA
jgi:spore germination protein YaaH